MSRVSGVRIVAINGQMIADGLLSAEREVPGSILGRTNTQILKISED